MQSIVKQCRNLGLAWRHVSAQTCDYLCKRTCGVLMHVGSSQAVKPWALCGVSGIYVQVSQLYNILNHKNERIKLICYLDVNIIILYII